MELSALVPHKCWFDIPRNELVELGSKRRAHNAKASLAGTTSPNEFKRGACSALDDRHGDSASSKGLNVPSLVNDLSFEGEIDLQSARGT